MGIAVEQEGHPLTRSASMGIPTTTISSSSPSSNNYNIPTASTIISGMSVEDGSRYDHNSNSSNNKPHLRSEGSRSYHRSQSNPMADYSSSSLQFQQQQQQYLDEETGGMTTTTTISTPLHKAQNFSDDSDSESHTSSTTHSHDGVGGGDQQQQQQQPFLPREGDGPEEGEDNSNLPTNICGFLQVLKDDILDYLHLLRTNRAFRLFLCSYVFGHMGEWFTYIASISLMERMLNSPTGLDVVLQGDDDVTAAMAAAATTGGGGGGDNDHSRTGIGVLVMIRLLPTVLLSPFGGVLADSRDRRKSMIVLDLIGACTPILFILATFLETSSSIDNIWGVGMIYLATICQECVCALYEPCRTSIVPLLVTGNDNDLKKATTLTGVAWSAVAALAVTMGAAYLVADAVGEALDSRVATTGTSRI